MHINPKNQSQIRFLRDEDLIAKIICQKLY